MSGPWCAGSARGSGVGGRRGRGGCQREAAGGGHGKVVAAADEEEAEVQGRVGVVRDPLLQICFVGTTHGHLQGRFGQPPH